MARANKKYLDQVKEKISKMPPDKARSYLIGALKVVGNAATQKELIKIKSELKGWY